MAKASKPKSVDEGAKTPIVSDRGLAFAVYILLLAGFVTGLTAAIGAVIAYLQRDHADALTQSHFQFQLRTFLIGLLYLFIGGATLHVGLGALVLLWWIIWTLMRCVKGLLALNAGEPIAEPNSWLFGDAARQSAR
jgi:uncharacterized membrane protein